MGSIAMPPVGLGAMAALDAMNSPAMNSPAMNNPAMAAAKLKAAYGSGASAAAKAKAASQDFEAVFLNSMFQEMFTGLKGEGPFGGNGATGIWRSFLVDEYSKTFAKAGGIGIGDQVYKTLLAQQEARP
jgi:Rod binding domain-containing protein